MPHIPQLFGSVVVSEQPDMQHVCPPVHAGWPLQLLPCLHMLFWQVSPIGQALPHMPQLSGSVRVLVQPVMQQLSIDWQAGPPSQPEMHIPPMQTPPGPQSWPHEPQFCGSFLVLVSQPSDASMLQSAKPESHEVILHMLPEQPPLPCWTGGHLLSHMPQFCGSFVVFAQVELSQQVKPIWQV
jgi:hypothetical protein